MRLFSWGCPVYSARPAVFHVEEMMRRRRLTKAPYALVKL